MAVDVEEIISEQTLRLSGEVDDVKDIVKVQILTTALVAAAATTIPITRKIVLMAAAAPAMMS